MFCSVNNPLYNAICLLADNLTFEHGVVAEKDSPTQPGRWEQYYRGGIFWLALERCMGFYGEIEGKVMLGRGTYEDPEMQRGEGPFGRKG